MNEIVSLILKLLRQIPEGLDDVWIIGILPAYFLIYMLLGVIILRWTGSGKLSREIRDFRRHSVSELLRRYLQRYYNAAVIVTLYAILLPSFVILNLQHDTILTALSANIYNLCSMVIGLTTIVLTVSVVIILFHKNYYLVFSITDVLKSYHFTGCLGMLLANCLGVCVCTMLQLYFNADLIWYKLVLLVMEWCILNCLVLSGFSFWVIYRVMFSNQKVELRLLNRLCRIFRGAEKPDESQASSADTWDMGAVKTNLEYLCAEYISTARLIPIHKVKHFFYLSGEARKETWNEIYRKGLHNLIYGAMGIWLFSMLVVAFVLGTEGTGILILNTFMMAAVTFPAMLGFRHHSERTELLVDDALGYVMEMTDGKKIRIPRMTVRPAKKYDKFVSKMNSISAFFSIGLERGMRQEMTDAAIDIVFDWISDVKEKHVCLYLPVFAAGYFAFSVGQRPSAVRECYQSLAGSAGTTEGNASPDKKNEISDLSKIIKTNRSDDSIPVTGTDPDDFFTMIYGHLEDLTKETASSNQITEYMNWLTENFPDRSRL